MKKPTRAAELEGGSVYWVLGGVMQLRFPIVRQEPVPAGLDDFWRLGGRHTWCLWLDVIEGQLVQPRHWPAFRGWRYLAADAAPPDLDRGADDLDAACEGKLPPHLDAELKRLGL